ncbi:hypothetical protein, partial [Companilactobacillus halodurans]|uniref:hypothetical protein n=1 Tax=Companilactobacillus halodurans TaxID=2584183 RepID=UPI001EE30912
CAILSKKHSKLLIYQQFVKMKVKVKKLKVFCNCRLRGQATKPAVGPTRAKVSTLDFELRTTREFQNTSCGVSDKSLTPPPLLACPFFLPPSYVSLLFKIK